jgi:hypothetical protein
MAFNAAEPRDKAGKWTKEAAAEAIKGLKVGTHIVGPNGAHVKAVSVRVGGKNERRFRVNHANRQKTYESADKAAAHAARAPQPTPETRPDMLTLMNKFMETSPAVRRTTVPEPKYKGVHHQVAGVDGLHHVFDRNGKHKGAYTTVRDANEAITRNTLEDPGATKSTSQPKPGSQGWPRRNAKKRWEIPNGKSYSSSSLARAAMEKIRS